MSKDTVKGGSKKTHREAQSAFFVFLDMVFFGLVVVGFLLAAGFLVAAFLEGAAFFATGLGAAGFFGDFFGVVVFFFSGALSAFFDALFFASAVSI